MGYVFLGIVVALALYVIAIYNSLVAKKNQIENGFAQIEVQLKRRYDLIPNLVKVAKSYMKYESKTLEAVITARNQASDTLHQLHTALNNADGITELGRTEQGLVTALGSMTMLMEDYPDLKANETILRLMEELSTTENRIAFARQAYNDFVYAFNADRQSFPQNQLVGWFGFHQDASMLKFEDSQAIQAIPTVTMQ